MVSKESFSEGLQDNKYDRLRGRYWWAWWGDLSFGWLVADIVIDYQQF